MSDTIILTGTNKTGDTRRKNFTLEKLVFARRYASPILLVSLWQLACSSGLLSTRLLASPAQIAVTGWTLVRDGTLPYNLGVSLLRAASGLGIAISVGVVLALISGLSRLGEDIVDAPLQILRTLPALALVPLFILWFGIGEAPKILLVALGATFPIYLNLHKGIRTIDPKLLEMTSTLGFSRWQTIRDVFLPGALPDFLTGLRYAVGVSWLMLVVAEQVNAESGIGHMMMDAEDFLRTDIILVGLLVYGVLGLLSDQIVRFLESTLLAWRPDRRKGQTV
ncbi:ABC transporter permease [Gluconobacter kanchanaburiensis]|uniref:ABC transporter permease n=1 Tax=Gluconobacter kanchanaburiensis NBRC 103587 TaxID=1307948 RepID=A0A511BC34_9PROT|nr:ABC transporter permease [Gluconobacter kanchanaburiensis]MBF0861757.1 ABC transporter permease [Gluconobacter kanchanaburiensis]GBR67381.1 aliphatic sulfonates transporter permease [Gluconobacter kanchanaburiensis NBRC 103587]GEK95407.1 ABC transporter permease [Gluconobacter kanchanaburiensis NBRC 103587]